MFYIIICNKVNKNYCLAVVHAFNPCTGKAETGEPLSLRSAWSPEQVPGQAPKLQKDSVLRNNNNNNRNYLRSSEVIPLTQFDIIV